MLLLIVQRSPEKHDVWLRSVDRVVNPPSALLNSNCSPLVLSINQSFIQSIERKNWEKEEEIEKGLVDYLGEETVLGKHLGDLRREHDMPAKQKASIIKKKKR